MSTGRQDGRQMPVCLDGSPTTGQQKGGIPFSGEGHMPHAQIIIDRSSSSEMAIFVQREAHALKIATHVAAS